MARYAVFILPLFFLLAVIPCAFAEAPDAKALYGSKCAGCHGINGGGTDKGPPLVHRIYRPGHHSDLSIRMAISRGVSAHHWNFGNMPRIEGIGPDGIDGLIGYIRRMQKEAGVF